MSNTVKIKGHNVFLNDKVVGHVGFTRGRYGNGQLDINGYFIFSLDDTKYRLDTSCFGYSADANKWLRALLTEKGENALYEMALSNETRVIHRDLKRHYEYEDEGYRTAAHDLYPHKNPYSAGSYEHRAWNRGYSIGRKNR